MERVELSKLGALMVLVFVSVGLVSCGGESKKVNSGSDWSTGNPGSSTLNLALTGTQLRLSWSNQSGITEYQLLENPDGISGYTVIATLAPNILVQNLNIFLPDRINASYILRACNSSGCTDSSPVFVSSNLAEAVSYIKASNTDEGDLFGMSLALSNDGNTLIVGATGEASSSAGVNGNQLDNSGRGGDWGTGAVYVFVNNGSTWTQQAYLKASNPDEGDWFGHSVSLSGDGNTLAVGAPNEDSTATGINGNQSDNSASGNPPIDGSGAVYIFTRSGTTWSQQAYVKASNTQSSDQFGFTLAISDNGNTLAVTSHGEDSNAIGIGGNQSDNSALDSGAVYIFTRSGSNWSQQAYIKASNTEEFDGFGVALALSSDGNTLAVGASGERSDANGVNGDQSNNLAYASGATYVFTRSASVWSQQSYIKASNTDSADSFGLALSLSGDGNTLAVGACAEDSNATGVNGNQSDNSAPSSGSVYIFSRISNTWLQDAYLKASNNEPYDAFGALLSISRDGNKLVVGTAYEDSNAIGIGGDQSDNTASYSGAAYIFIRRDGDWVQSAYVKASNTDSNDRFGTAVSLSGNGNRLAIGANLESSNATGIGGDQLDNSAPYSGAVYLY